MKNKYMKIGIVSIFMILLGVFAKKIIMENEICKTENGYEIIGFGGKPVNIDDKIKKEKCKCITESLLFNPNPKKFSPEQLAELRNELPEWASKNIKDFSDNDKKELADILKLEDAELLKKFEYQFSYFGKPASEEIPVYIFKIKSVPAYCPNFTDEYAVYGKKDKFGVELYPLKDKPDYPKIENKDWAKTELGRD